MRQNRHHLWLWLVLLVCAVFTNPASANDLSKKKSSWALPTAESLKASLQEILAAMATDADKTTLILDEWSEASQAEGVDQLNLFIQQLAKASPELNELLKMAESNPTDAYEQLLYLGWLDQKDAEDAPPPEALVNNVRAWLGREFVIAKMFDEALDVFGSLDALTTIDPASVFFYRGTCYFSLLQKEAAVKDLNQLLLNADLLPMRYSRTAQLMLTEIEPLEEDTLDEISRLMTDVTRRLDLGRTNDDVEKREQIIIDKLDKLIKDMEDQQKQQQEQQQQAQQQGQGQSQGQSESQGQAMQESQIAENKGAGDVDKKSLSNQRSWGSLPPAEREEAIQSISRDLPTHYREAIEAYFRKLATSGSSP